MDPEEEQQNQDQDQQPLGDQGLTKKVAKKGFQALRGLGAAGEAAEAAEAGAVAAGAESTAGGTAAATGATEGLAAAAAGEAGATTAAGGIATGAASAEGALTGTAIASGSASMGWAIAAVLIIVLFFVFVIVITGGGAGINTGGGVPPTPTPGPGSELPKIINFKGGHAYLSCSKTEIINCQSSSLGDPVTMFAIFYVDNTFSANKDTAMITIGPFSTSFFDILNSNIKPRPDIRTLLSPNYTWKLSTVLRSAEKGSDPNEYIISMGVGKPLKSGPTDVTLSLEGFGELSGGDGGGGDLGDIYASQDHEPTNNTCSNNKYLIYMNIVKSDVKRIPPFDNPILLSPNANYGDPVCTFKQDRLTQVIKDNLGKYGQNSNDDRLVSIWKDIQECEGTPNSHDVCTDADYQNGYCNILGTWGMYQMGAFWSAGKKWTQVSARGDVTWQRQVQNAIGYNHQILNDDFSYWGTARCMCWHDKYANSHAPYCNKIRNANLTRSPSSGKCSTCTATKGNQ